MKKRFLAIILASLMCLAVLPMGAFAVGYTVVLEPTSEYETDYRVSEALLAVHDGNFNYVAIPLQLQYEDFYGFHDGFARVKKDGKYGYIDTTGKQVIACQFDYAYGFSDGLECV